MGVLSFISLSSSWRSFLGCLRGVGPLRNLVCNPDHILSHHVPGLLHPGCQHLHPSFLHSKAGIRATARWHTQHLRMQKGGTGAWARLGLVFGSPLLLLLLFFSSASSSSFSSFCSLFKSSYLLNTLHFLDPLFQFRAAPSTQVCVGINPHFDYCPHPLGTSVTTRCCVYLLKVVWIVPSFPSPLSEPQFRAIFLPDMVW